MSPVLATLDQTLASRCQSDPNATALVQGLAAWSYADLWSHSGAWAQSLTRRGIGPGDVVAVMMRKSPEMIAALVAINRSGAAFMAIDASWPDARVDYMLTDARCRLLLIDDSTSQKPCAAAVTKLTPADLTQATSTTGSLASVDPDATAYVIYTSGSTGSPKGVTISHRAAVMTFTADDVARMASDEAVLQLANVGFDASQYEIWGALLNGARLVLPEIEKPSLAVIADMVVLHGITTLFLTTGLFHLMVDNGIESLYGLRRLVTGGDALGARQARRAAAALPGTSIINIYGPTEATTYATRWVVPAGFAGDVVPIGTAMAATDLDVVDDDLRPVPVGEAGELLLSGPRLARGYLHDASRTAERFVTREGYGEARFYRTGDRVRVGEGGNLEFLGRTDFQVKIRGFRVEPGEIETHLRQIPGVRDAVVMAPRNAKGEKNLVAWITIESSAGDDSELVRQLQALMPAYMIPQHFIRMKSFPLTANGKVDRARLDAPGLNAARSEDGSTLPAVTHGAPLQDPRLDTTVDRVVQAIADSTPEALAVVDGDGDHTYGQLLSRATAIAAALRHKDWPGNPHIAIALAPGFDAIAAQLGVMMAGAAAIPLDPREADGRLGTLIETVVPAGLIVQCRSEGERAAFRRVNLLALDDLDSCTQVSRVRTDHCATSPAHFAFTSGSTGRPKAVMIEHGAILHHALGLSPILGIAPGARMLQHCAQSWDVYIFETYTTLIAGATIIVAGDTPRRSVEFGAFATRHGVTHALATPTLLDSLDGRHFPTLSTIVAGGETLRSATAARWAEGRRLFNGYGPSEATVLTTLFACSSDQNQAPALGSPLPGQTITVVDASLLPVGTGVEGEILIGGGNLARGYWADPERTNRAFVTLMPSGDRYYRTGDLGLVDDSGVLHFRGRKDDQIKVNGYRIEPDEVAGTLERHHAVTRAVVYSVEADDRNRLAAAYIVKPDAVAPTPEDLRNFLRGELPAGHVPSLFYALESLPILANGKTDRRQLPRPESSGGGTMPASRPQRSALDDIIAKAWLAATGQVPEHDGVDFFTSGGDSLMALAMIDALTRATGIDLAIAQFMAHATPRKLALILAGSGIATAVDDGVFRAWHDDAALADDVVFPKTKAPVASMRHVLLTGATGFLGTWLVNELQARSEARIYVIVRGAKPGAARQRLESRLAAAGLPSPIDWRRICVLAGDLAKPRLGLSEFLFQSLAGRLDTVIHNGADVHFLKTYEQLRDANVGSVHAILALAQRNPALQIHYVSTVGTAGIKAMGQPLLESDLANPRDVDGGYLQSKWVAESLMGAAAVRGARVVIHRPGRIAPDCGAGQVHAQDLLTRFARSCARLGAVPALNDPFDLVPVDWVAAAMTTIILSQPQSLPGQTFHYVNPASPSLVDIARICQQYGQKLQLISWQEWRSRAEAMAASEPDFPLRPLLSLFPKDEVQPGALCLPAYDCTATRRLVAAPELSPQWLVKLWTQWRQGSRTPSFAR